ncbi:MAG: WxcM-like domain-containing protein [Bacteroidales bacterium]|nr:WxcM-like domain-containing protein [Bacteroidales bacterium]
MISSVYNCGIIELSKIHNRAGNITVVENHMHAPFDVKRVYFLYDVPGGANRGGHAHKTLQQFIIAASGAFDVKIDDGINEKIIHLDRPYLGLHIVPGIWRELLNFSSGAVCLVLASHLYEVDDYIRDYNEYLYFRRI